MPMLTLRIAPLQNPERYAQLARALTAITASTLGKRPEVTALTVQDLPSAAFFVGGEVVQRPAFHLEVAVTAGTNTAAEKAAFVRAADAELRRQLGAGAAVEEASYVIVREVPADAWGYGGHTQAARRLAREAVAA